MGPFLTLRRIDLGAERRDGIGVRLRSALDAEHPDLDAELFQDAHDTPVPVGEKSRGGPGSFGFPGRQYIRADYPSKASAGGNPCMHRGQLHLDWAGPNQLT